MNTVYALSRSQKRCVVFTPFYLYTLVFVVLNSTCPFCYFNVEVE